MVTRRALAGIGLVALGWGVIAQPSAQALPSASAPEAQSVVAHWTPARMAAAVPRALTVGATPAAATPTSRSSQPTTRKAEARPTLTPLATWNRKGDVRSAIGRLYFEMVFDGERFGFVCSGTVVKDSLRNASAILTAAHCIYDDASGVFAQNVMFVPDQASSTSGTDLNCRNDIVGCWVPTSAAVDPQWDAVEWPDNLAYDYGFYLVPDSGRHVQGVRSAPDALDAAVDALEIAWSARESDDRGLTYALGYPFDYDPALMYCSERAGTIDGIANYTNLWLPNCELGDGSSGGPWLLAEGRSLEGDARVYSLNSWGNDTGPGMAGPVLQDSGRALGRPHALYNRLSALSSSADALIGTLTTWF